ncbi:MAG: sugar phosphate isomerase/epimerase [Acidobacteria bacterium]|nr:sugar phosphate isomerase/epimerase [Acidobacteriota bacterium]
MLSRRDLLLTPAALLAVPAAGSIVAAAGGRMTLALHQNTSSRAGFRGSLEGWARAGITQVEITQNLLDQFLKTDSLAAAKRVLDDLHLTPVSGACGVIGLLESGPARAAAVDSFKQRCEQWAELGVPRIYATTQSTLKPTADDYKAAAGYVVELAGIARQHQLTVMFEAMRNSTFISTITTMLSVTRAAAQPNAGLLFDCYHFWSGLGKLEDLDTVKPGEIKHVHFQDVPDMPREMLDITTRYIPGDGVAPLPAILQKVAATGYSGPLSVELFLPKFSAADPYEVAREIRTKAEAVMQKAGVI